MSDLTPGLCPLVDLKKNVVPAKAGTQVSLLSHFA